MHFEAMASFLSVILRCVSDDAEQPRSRASSKRLRRYCCAGVLVIENARGRATAAAIVFVASSGLTGRASALATNLLL